MDANAATPDFVRLWTLHAKRIYAYLLTLVAHRADADDLFQETSSVLWQKFDQFQPGTDFYAWACRTAYFNVCNFRRRQSIETVVVNDELLELLNTDLLSAPSRTDLELNALADCYAQLKPRDQDLITRRYRSGGTIHTVSVEVGRSVEGLYKAIKRIHEALFDCVQQKLAEEGRT